MRKEEFYYPSIDNEVQVHALRYFPDSDVKAILQISHGMKEYVERYEDFAEYLCSKGFFLTGNDHLGHGKSINSKDDLGYFSSSDGSDKELKNMYELTKMTKELYPNIPYFLLGHSMGSFFARRFICEYGKELDGVVIMGTGHQPKLLVNTGMFICKLLAHFKGDHYVSRFVDSLAFGAYNKRFEPIRTKFDWLTKDEEIVDKYLNDEASMFDFTVNGYYNMFDTISRLYDKNYLNRIPKDLPILFISGDQDPVGDYFKGVLKAADSLKEVGIENIEVARCENDRHEVLKELDRDLVYERIYKWLLKYLNK